MDIPLNKETKPNQTKQKFWQNCHKTPSVTDIVLLEVVKLLFGSEEKIISELRASQEYINWF